ncbi:MAG: S-layer homology domain-containing protein [Clostridiales bacterium]|nr:S-layer homology domain-containing protein [Clostridiales bacterium]
MKHNNIIICLLSFIVIISSLNISFAAENNKCEFSDVYPTDWYYNTVMEMVEKGYISGYDDGTFRPQQQMTIAEFSKVIFAALPEPNEAKSVSGAIPDAYLKNIEDYWGYQTGVELMERIMLFSGMTPAFSAESLNTSVTRSDVTAISYIAAKTSELNINFNFYSDCGCVIGDYGDCLADANCELILIMFSSGIMGGKGNTHNFAPKDYVTRAEACAIISRIINEDERISSAEMQSYEIQHEDAPLFTSMVDYSYNNSEHVTHDTAPVDYSYLDSVSKGTSYGGMTDSQKTEAQAVVNNFISNYIRPSMSDLRKVSIAAEYIMNNCSYGSDTAESAYTAWGALVGHAAWCTGFSYAFKMICDAMDIGCVVVPANESASNPSHMWAEVKIDGYWYVIDVQAMDLARDFEVEYGQSFYFGEKDPNFLVSYESYANYNSMACDTEKYPVCSYNYFASEEQ